MGTGQMMITVGAMFLLGLTVLNVNRGYLMNGTVISESQYNIMAVSLAVSIIEDANGKAFDENTAQAAVIGTSALSTIGFSGERDINGNAEYWESREDNNLDDFDDYNGITIYTNTDSTLISAAFKIECSVNYAKENAPDENASGKTWYKRLDVIVSSEEMADTVRMSSLMSYFYFR